MKPHYHRPGQWLKPSERLRLGRRVRELTSRGFSIEEIAKLLGIDHRLVTRIRVAQQKQVLP